jgi:acetone monooxygenase
MTSNAAASDVEEVDAVVVGAGVFGLYQVYRLVRQGLKVRAFEAGSDVGGVWYWNRYPGARVDSHFPFYQYWFSRELWDEADWKQRFPGQPEIEAYLRRVCDKYGLRRHISFDTRVSSAHFDEARGRWLVSTEAGRQVSAQFVVFCTGGLSVARTPPFPGHESFKGITCHTSHWPREGVPLAGKRVGVIGTAATGIQVIQTIAAEVAHLVVFQRTANYAVAMRNDPVTAGDLARMRAGYESLRERAHKSFGGFVYDTVPPPFDDVPADQRTAYLESVWADGSLRMWGNTFADAFKNPEAAAFISDFVRNKIRERVKDPAVAEKLMPKDYQFGTRRVPLENGYFDVFNRGNVQLVDVKDDPIVSVDQTGINTASGHHDLDVIIYATGFEAGVGALNQVDIVGRAGAHLRDLWKESVRTTVGMQVHGFPNMFLTMAPFAPAAALCNIPICADQQVDWISDAIAFVRQRGAATIEPQAATEAAWMAHHAEVSEPTLIGRNANSWYRLKGPGGEARELIAYMGGVNRYRELCDAYRSSGYAGFDVA